MTRKSKVDIGFVDECEEWKLHPRFFPSKVGGKPSWLNLQDLPKPSDLQCGKCGEPCIFLCQVYAPIDDDPDAFHRTIFVFICKNGACCEANNSQNILVFRCQLKRENNFYSYDPPKEEPDDEMWSLLVLLLYALNVIILLAIAYLRVKRIIIQKCNEPFWNFDKSKMTSLCEVCGAKGPSHCAKCKVTKYCCRSHQVYHWKNGHKERCTSESTEIIETKKSSILFPQWELIIDEESEDKPSNKTSEEEEMKKYKKLLEEKKAGTLVNESESELEQYASKDVEDKAFDKFKKKTEVDPGQVLRYDRGGTPLWITSKHIIDTQNIPNCQVCGGKRRFEFQIMPQLLNFLNLDLGVSSIDWGILAIYTCEKNCTSSGGAYKKEFVYKQDIVQDSN